MKFDPFAQFSKALETWQDMAIESCARTAAFYSEVDKLEARNIERAETAIQEVAKLTKESLAYTALLGSEWRKLTLEAIQRAPTAFAGGDAAAR